LGHPPVYLTYADGGAWSTLPDHRARVGRLGRPDDLCCSTCVALGTHAGNPVSLSFATGPGRRSLPSLRHCTVSSLTCPMPPIATRQPTPRRAAPSSSTPRRRGRSCSPTPCGPDLHVGLSCTRRHLLHRRHRGERRARDHHRRRRHLDARPLLGEPAQRGGHAANIDVFPASQTRPSSSSVEPKVFYPSETGYLSGPTTTRRQAAANMGVTSCSNSANNGWLTRSP